LPQCWMILQELLPQTCCFAKKSAAINLFFPYGSKSV